MAEDFGGAGASGSNGNGHRNGNSRRAYDGHRPHKIVIIGNGSIGQELFRKLTNEGKADEVVVWNRSSPTDEVKFDRDNEPLPTEMARLEAFHRDVDEGNRALLRYSRSPKPTSHFTKMYGEERLPEAMKDADIVIVTAGAKRDFVRNPDGTLFKDENGKKVSEKREVLVEKNYKFITRAAENAYTAKPDANFIVLTNPVDNMTQLFQEKSGFKPEQVIGLGGVLDETRLERAISATLGIHPDDIQNLKVVGQHGEHMIPIIEDVQVCKNGVWMKLTDVASADELATIKKETKGGGQWYQDKQNSTAHIAPAMAASVMVDAIIDSKWKGESVPPIQASAWLESEQTYIGHTIHFDHGKVVSHGKPSELSRQDESYSRANEATWDKAVKALRAGMAEMPDRQGQGMAMA